MVINILLGIIIVLLVLILLFQVFQLLAITNIGNDLVDTIMGESMPMVDIVDVKSVVPEPKKTSRGYGKSKKAKTTKSTPANKSAQTTINAPITEADLAPDN
jgi:hypothetical protein